MKSIDQEKAKKELLILTCVHGNEDFANKPVSRLQQEFGDRFDWIIGNPEALAAQKRFTQVDMNRIAPGQANSAVYEMKRADELLRIARQYPYVLDIHGTVSDCGIFTLVPYPTNLKRFALASALPIDDMVVWADQAEKESGTGPLSPFMPCAVAIECGPKNKPEIANQLYDILKPVVRDGIGNSLRDASPKKNMYRVYGSLKKADIPDGTAPSLKDFREVTVGEESFYPLLSGQYEVLCYKMKRVDLFDLFAYSQGRELRSSK